MIIDFLGEIFFQFFLIFQLRFYGESKQELQNEREPFHIIIHSYKPNHTRTDKNINV